MNSLVDEVSIRRWRLRGGENPSWRMSWFLLPGEHGVDFVTVRHRSSHWVPFLLSRGTSNHLLVLTLTKQLRRDLGGRWRLEKRLGFGTRYMAGERLVRRIMRGIRCLIPDIREVRVRREARWRRRCLRRRLNRRVPFEFRRRGWRNLCLLTLALGKRHRQTLMMLMLVVLIR